MLNRFYRPLSVTVAAITVSILATACAPDQAESSSAPPQIEHIHDLAFSEDNTLLIGSHDGVYARKLDTQDTTLVGDVSFDAMGMTAQGDDVFVSGHPGSQDHEAFAAPHIGLVQHSPQAGWEPVALAGSTDFHNLSTTPADPELVLGLPSDRAVLLRSTDAGRTFTAGAQLSARDLSIDTEDPSLLTATTAEGILVSSDGGTTFAALAGAPTLVTIAPDPTRPDGLVGVDPDGSLWIGFATPDAEWTQVSRVTGGAAAITVSGDGTIAVADESGVITTQDEGATWTTVISA